MTDDKGTPFVTCHSLPVTFEMFGIDLTSVIVIFAALIVLFLVIDLVFAGGAMTGGMMGATAQCGAAMLGSPYGWMLIVALVVIILIAFGMMFGMR